MSEEKTLKLPNATDGVQEAEHFSASCSASSHRDLWLLECVLKVDKKKIKKI